MHLLKRLELNGFKSFAQKTTFEFPTGITAIVGPNGSGKSNVIDAVRWLLGEREAKNLRGAKAEDLIFAGTPKRARVGQAQAALHFENGNSFFPVEFSEIAIARRVDRDGTNKFFLNKSEIRLKDLIDFFAKARLGAKGLVVITQGNSDIFVRAAPAARREMIEEMLGLREYQLKKAAAERRLKNTEINLEKADALMKELAPHLRSLKRQTGRWERREALAEELRDAERRFFGTQWRELEAKKSEVEREIAAHREEADALEAEKKAAEENLKKVEASRPREREETAKLKKELASLMETRSGFQKELGRLEAQLEMAEARRESDLVAPDTLIALLKKFRTRFEAVADADLESLRKCVRESLAEITAVFSDGGSGKNADAASGMRAQLAALKEKAKKLGEEISNTQKQEEALAAREEGFYGLFKKAVSEVEGAKDKIEKWEAKNQSRLFEKERFELRFSELKRQIGQAGRNEEEFARYTPSASAEESFSGLEKRIFKLRGDLASIGEVDEALLKEARETESRYEFLEREFKDLGNAKNDLRNLIAELGEKIRTEFREALGGINEEFGKFFKLMFDGGSAKLRIMNPSPLLAKVRGEAGSDAELPVGEKNGVKVDAEEEEKPEEGIEVSVSLPRKRINSLETLSGGERSLVGIAILFAMISVSPPPFLVLDEIDAALDAKNSRRFADLLKEFSKKTQFIVVTHNRAVMEAADVLYGITLNEDGTSKVLSLKLETPDVIASEGSPPASGGQSHAI